MHIPSSPVPDREALLHDLHSLYTLSPFMSTYVDIHLVLDAFERQFNLWRNVARYYARTDYVMMLDVDFAVCTDFRALVQSAFRSAEDGDVLRRFHEGKVALVVPAFEFIKQKDGVNASMFPTDKKVSAWDLPPYA